MKRRADDPNQLSLPVFIPTVVERRGEEFIVKPGRPITELTSEQLASHFRVDPKTVRRWREDGTIPDQPYVRRAGKRKLLFRADVIDHLNTVFTRLHE